MFYDKRIKFLLACILTALAITGYADISCGNRKVFGKDQAAVGGKPESPSSENVTSDNYLYGIGSVSKIFGTAAVMKLAEEGRLDLDKPLTGYLPEFRMADERYRQITPRMLLNHSSGLMGTSSHNAFVYGASDTAYHDTFLELLQDQTLKADPGEYSVYCNDGFMLAEILVERVSGMSFPEYIRKEFTEPLGLNNTLVPSEGLGESKTAPVYFGSHKLPYVNCQPLASGGIYSTPEDLCRFSRIFMKEDRHNILSEKSTELMAKPWYLEDNICVSQGDSQIGYGLGWDCVNAYPYNLYGIKALTKGGDVNGYHANLTVMPEQNLSIAVTASGGSSIYCEEAAQDIILEVLKEEGLIDDIKDIKIKADYEPDTAPLPEEMRQYEGYYISQNMLKISFDDQGTLLLTPLDSKYDTVQEYVYTKTGEFVSVKGYYLDPTGRLVSNANGNKGLTKFSFRKEKNGKTYIIGTTYESTLGLGEIAYTTAFAEKIEPNILSDSVLAEWGERSGKTYYIVNEAWNSNAYLNNSSISFEPIEGISGYVTGSYKEDSKNKCRITDEDTAVCEIDLPGMIGRDLADYKFIRENGAEYVLTGTCRYIGEEAVRPSAELTEGSVTVGNDRAVWYEIPEQAASSVLEITAPDNGAWYVYDKEDTCIDSSIFKEEAGSVLLPADGHIVFAGKAGTVFQIKRK